MARQDVQLNLPGIEVTPAAQPVDTYYRTNLPKPADMVTNSALQLGQALAALSPTLRDFAAWREEGAREHDEEAAQLTAQDLSDEQLKNINKWTEEEWKQFGDQGGRPTFQIATQVYANRRIAKEMIPDIVAEYEAMKGEMLDPTKTPDIAQMVSELGGRWRGKFEGHYARQGAESILGPLLEKIEGEAHESRKKALSDHEDANFSQAAYDTFVSIGSGVSEADEFLSKELLKREAGSLSGKSPAELRGLAQGALARAAQELVKEDPVHGKDLAMELLDRADEELGLDGKPLFRPGTEDAEKLAAAVSDVRRLVRERDYEDRGDVTDVVTDLASKFKMENPEATEEQIIAWRDTVLRPRLLDMGLTEEQIQSELLAGQEFIEKRVDEEDSELLTGLRVGVYTGTVSEGDVLAAVTRGDIDWSNAKPLLEKMERDADKGSSVSDALLRSQAGAVAKNAGDSVLGFSLDALPEESQQAARALTDRFTAAFTQEMAEAGDDAAAQTAVVARYSEGGEALKNFRAEAKEAGWAAQRADIQLDPIFDSVSSVAGNYSRVFMNSLPEAVESNVPLQVDLLGQFDSLLRGKADLVRLRKIADGVTDPQRIAAAVELDLKENASVYIEEMQTAVDTAAAEATRVLEQGFAAADAAGGEPAFLDVDVSTGLLPYAGVYAGKFDLGDLWDDNESVLEDPLGARRQELLGDAASFTANTVEILTAFVEGNVSTYKEAAEAAGWRQENTGELYYAGGYDYLPQTRWVGDGLLPRLSVTSTESITIDGTTVDRDGAKKLLNSLLGLQGIPSEDLLTAEEPINIGVADNPGIIPIWFKPGEHAEFDAEIQALTKDGQIPSEEALEATKWGQIVKSLGFPQILTTDESAAPRLMAVILSKQQHSLHNTTKGNQ